MTGFYHIKESWSYFHEAHCFFVRCNTFFLWKRKKKKLILRYIYIHAGLFWKKIEIRIEQNPFLVFIYSLTFAPRPYMWTLLSCHLKTVDLMGPTITKNLIGFIKDTLLANQSWPLIGKWSLLIWIGRQRRNKWLQGKLEQSIVAVLHYAFLETLSLHVKMGVIIELVIR